MPYIPPQNRPAIDAAVGLLAEEIAGQLRDHHATATISELYRAVFMEMADYIADIESDTTDAPAATTAAQRVGQTIVEMAKGYNQQGGWLGELNYAVTTLIQAVPFRMYEAGDWQEALRYWLYAETVGALVRTSYEIHAKSTNNWVANGLAGVFEDVKDEYKRRVNTAYEAAQILKSGDCFDMAPFRTQLVETEVAGVKGYAEVMLPWQRPRQAASPKS